MARRDKQGAGVTVRGTARIGRRTKALTRRLNPGDIAVIDHADLDPVAADALVDAGVVAVVNAAPSISGRYPNTGPLRLVRAGVVLIDDTGPDVLEELRDGATVLIDGDQVWRDGSCVAKGERLGAEVIEERMETARHGIGRELREFAANTLRYVEEEASLTFEPLSLPRLDTNIDGRHVLVVVRGVDYREDLRALRAYIGEYRPVLIGVDGGADALVENGLKPDIVIGDFDSVSESTLHRATDLVHHVHPDGRAPGREELAEFGVEYEEFVVEGTSEDAAMLLAWEAGAKLIVAVGTHATMVEFLDKGRGGMASTFLTRLRIGPMLVDAKGVSRLYEGRVRRRDIALLIGSALLVILVLAIASDALHVFLDALWLRMRDLWLSLTGAF